jgi:hypothetical protein
LTLSAGQGTKTVYAWVKDNNNTVSAVSSAATSWDDVAPSASLTIGTPSPATTPLISVTASGNDLGGSPIAKYALVSGTAAPTLSSVWKDVAPTSYTLPAGNGLKTISLFVKDAAGNVSAANTKTITLTVGAPTLTLNIVPAVSKSLTVSISTHATDPSGTGIKGYYLSTSSSTPLVSASGWKASATTFVFPAGDGTRTLYGWVKDGNKTVSAVSSDTLVIDQTAPVATLTVTGNNTAGVSVTISGTDGGSGITGYAIVYGTTPPTASDPLAWSALAADAGTIFTANLLSPTSSQTISGFVKDAAGNVSAANSKSVQKP